MTKLPKCDTKKCKNSAYFKDQDQKPKYDGLKLCLCRKHWEIIEFCLWEAKEIEKQEND